MPTPDKNKAALEGLIAKANAATGGDAATVTDAVDTLIAGFGQGGGENLLDYARNINGIFNGANFGGGKDVVLDVGAKAVSAPAVNCLQGVFLYTKGVKTIKLIYRAPAGSSNFNDTFGNATGDNELELIDISETINRITITAMSGTFRGRRGLKTVLGEIDASAVTGFKNCFNTCSSLETIRFKSGTIKVEISFAECPSFSNDTIQSIIDGLADLTGGTAQTLTLHATVGAKLTDAQKAAASAKNWTLAY